MTTRSLIHQTSELKRSFLLPYRSVMGSFRRPRPRFMSSPVLSDLARFHASSSPLQLSNTSVWNSVQTAVLKVFQGEDLQNNELYSLNENIRWLLKTELGSFITEYFQNQLLDKGLEYILERIQLYEGEDQLRVLSETWIHFFTEILPTLQAIFCPVQGQEMTVRQMALLSFRDLVVLKLSLEELLPGRPASLPPAIPQMLLILQGIHEPSGPNEQYDSLEHLVELVVSPYLRNYLHRGSCEKSPESPSVHPRPVEALAHSQPEITVTQFATDCLLAPLMEQEGEAYLEKAGGIRRHTVANAHSDLRLLSAAGRVLQGKGGEDSLAISRDSSTFSSEPDILESPSVLAGILRRQTSAEMACALTS